MGKIDISNVVRISVLSALRGLGDIGTSVLAIITKETPIPSDYGTYGVYRNALGVAEDFGSDSMTYQMASMVFAQNANPITGGGYLVVVPRLSQTSKPPTFISTSPVDLTTLPATDYVIAFNLPNESEDNKFDIKIGDIDTTSIETVIASLNNEAVNNSSFVFTVAGTLQSATVALSFSQEMWDSVVGTEMEYPYSVLNLITPESGTNLAPLFKFPATASATQGGAESVNDCILRTADSVGYFGIVLDEVLSADDLLTVAATVQTMDRILFTASSDIAAISGVFTEIKGKSLSHTRCLYYSVSPTDALMFAAGYASVGLSTNFEGTGTAKTMHLKQIVNLLADPGMTQTLLNQVQDAGVDVYVDFGVPRTFTSGANEFYDQTYNRLAFKVRLQIAGFNFLATTTGKIPQTEEGMNGLKEAYRIICERFVSNGVFAPGKWNSSTTFGDPEDHRRNIEEVGYFIYSESVASQSQTVRESRVAPIIYIAAKESGAIHSSDVVVYVEA